MKKEELGAAAAPEFCRVTLGKCEQFGGRVGWVRVAREVQPSADKKTMVFRVLGITDARSEAEIYPATIAAAMIAVLGATYPGADVDPATFAEWVECVKEPGQ